MQWPPPQPWAERHELPAPASAATSERKASPPRKRGWLIPVLLLSLAAVVAVVLLTRGGNDSTTKDPDVTVDGSTVDSAGAATTVASTPPPPTPSPTPEPTIELIIETTAPSETSAPEESTTTEAPTTTSGSSSGPLAADLNLIVAAPDGTHLINGTTDNIVLGGSSAVSFRAFEGSYIVQTQSGRFEGSSEDTHIRRIADGSEAVIVAADGGEYLRLHDVSSGDGNDIFVMYSILEGTTPEDSLEGLYVLNLLEGRTSYIGVVGGWESGVSQLDLADDLIIGEASEQVSTSLYAVDRNGNPQDLTAALDLEDSYSDCAECPHHFSVDQAGRFVAWGENGSLVITDLTGAEPQRRIPVPGFVEGFGTDLDIRDGVVIINREQAVPIVVDTRGASPVISELAIIGHASFG